VHYNIELRPAALRDLKNIPMGTLPRISGKIDQLAERPRPPGVQKLSGSESFYRVSAGDYRILFEKNDDLGLVVIARIRHRREAYRG
jgi:mRNA interferase RelE/StbE